MLAVGVFQFDEFGLHLFGVKLHVVEELLVNVETLEGVFHLGGEHAVLEFHFLLEETAVRVEARHTLVNFLKNVELRAGVVDGVLEFLDLVRHGVLVGAHLVLGVLLCDEAIHDGVHNLLDKVSRLGHDIEPEQLEGRVLLAETLEVRLLLLLPGRLLLLNFGSLLCVSYCETC